MAVTCSASVAKSQLSRPARRAEKQGYEFATETDTEVLLTAFAQWGKQCLSRLNGMFHFAVWDNQERTLTLARDHVGIKPLYYCYEPASGTKPGLFIFSSEVKAILASGVVNRALDPEALNQFLTFLWAPDPNTLFAGIKTLPPAHVLTFHKDGSSPTSGGTFPSTRLKRGAAMPGGKSKRSRRSTK